jgi:hypothetical protein
VEAVAVAHQKRLQMLVMAVQVDSQAVAVVQVLHLLLHIHQELVV